MDQEKRDRVIGELVEILLIAKSADVEVVLRWTLEGGRPRIYMDVANLLAAAGCTVEELADRPGEPE